MRPTPDGHPLGRRLESPREDIADPADSQGRIGAGRRGLALRMRRRPLPNLDARWAPAIGTRLNHFRLGHDRWTLGAADFGRRHGLGRQAVPDIELRSADALVIAQVGDNRAGRPVSESPELHDPQAKLGQFRPVEQFKPILTGEILVDACRDRRCERHQDRVVSGCRIAFRGRMVLASSTLRSTSKSGPRRGIPSRKGKVSAAPSAAAICVDARALPSSARAVGAKAKLTTAIMPTAIKTERTTRSLFAGACLSAWPPEVADMVPLQLLTTPF